MRLTRHIVTSLTVLIACGVLTACKGKSESSDRDDADAAVATSTDTSLATSILTDTSTGTATSVITGSLTFTQPTLPVSATDIAAGSKARLLLLASGACQASTPAAVGTWSSHLVWKYLQPSTFVDLKNSNTELFTPLADILSSATQVCVVSDTEYTYQSGTSQTVSSIPVGTFAVIFAVDDSAGNVGAVALSRVSITSDVAATLSLSMQDIYIDVSGLSSALGSSLPAGSSLVFLSGTPMARLGVCSALTIGARDASGNLITPSSDVSLTLATTASSGQFYTDASCLTATTSAALHANTSNVVIYYRDNTLGSPTLTIAEASGLSSPATQAANIVSADTPQLAFTNGVLNQAVGVCGAIDLALHASNGMTPSSSQSALPVSLTSSSLTGSFYSDASCTYSLNSSVTLSSPYYATLIYYKDSTDGSPVLSASASNSAALSASLLATIGNGTTTPGTGGAATSLMFLGSPQVSASNPGCYSLTVQQVDAYGAPARMSSPTALSFSTTSSNGSFYAGVDCTQPITVTSISAGLSVINFSYAERSTGAPTLTVQASGLQSATTTLNVSVGSEPQIDFGGVFGYSGFVGGAITNPNLITGSSSCPLGYTATKTFGATNSYNMYVDYPIYFCSRTHSAGMNGPVDFGGFYSLRASGAALAINPITGSTNCPATFTSKLVIGTMNVDDMLFVCQRPHSSTSRSWHFGGMFGQGSVKGVPQSYANPLTGSLSCPAGFNSAQLLGTSGLDYPLSFCYQ